MARKTIKIKDELLCFYLPNDITSNLDEWKDQLKMNRTEVLERMISISGQRLIAKYKRKGEVDLGKMFEVNSEPDEVTRLIQEVPKLRQLEVERQKKIAEFKRPEMQSWLLKFEAYIRKLKEISTIHGSSNGGEAVEGTVRYEGET